MGLIFIRSFVWIRKEKIQWIHLSIVTVQQPSGRFVNKIDFFLKKCCTFTGQVQIKKKKQRKHHRENHALNKINKKDMLNLLLQVTNVAFFHSITPLSNGFCMCVVWSFLISWRKSPCSVWFVGLYYIFFVYLLLLADCDLLLLIV